jgi:hypothetical protein
LPQAHIALQSLHVLCLEDVFDQAIVFSQIAATTIAGDHARRVLTTMLKYG